MILSYTRVCPVVHESAFAETFIVHQSCNGNVVIGISAYHTYMPLIFDPASSSFLLMSPTPLFPPCASTSDLDSNCTLIYWPRCQPVVDWNLLHICEHGTRHVCEVAFSFCESLWSLCEMMTSLC
uniref:Uncharacterized protein n=1 Tax=Craspedostauros australis TaxID=1486917 RepID=A0A7R9ZN31_9STRA